MFEFLTLIVGAVSVPNNLKCPSLVIWYSYWTVLAGFNAGSDTE